MTRPPAAGRAPAPPTRAQRGRAWAVHAFTALGIVAAMLALRDVLTEHPDRAILWLLLTLVIDGVDGPVARALLVEERAPGIDGHALDLIIDYVTCVIVPACFMYEFRVVPQDNFGIAVLCLLVFTSAIWFARRDMMTEDYWFRGFPAAWNMVAPVMFLLQARAGLGAAVTIVLSLLSLTDLPFPHILRATFLRGATVTAAVVWVGAMIVAAVQYPEHPWATRPPLLAGCVYFAVLSVAKVAVDRRVGRVESAARV